MKAKGGGAPTGKLADAIAKDFGSLDEFKKQFAVAGNTAFGSGWAWLCKDATGKLVVTKTIGAGNPITEGLTPILTMDGACFFPFQFVALRFGPPSTESNAFLALLRCDACTPLPSPLSVYLRLKQFGSMRTTSTTKTCARPT